MNRLSYVLYQKGLLKITAYKVDTWEKEGQIEALILALKTGYFTERQQAALALGHLGHPKALPHLAVALYDKVQIVSEAAITAIQQLGAFSHYKRLIWYRRVYWHAKAIQIKAMRMKKHIPSKSQRKPPWDKHGNMQRLERVRQQLSKPIKWGDVM